MKRDVLILGYPSGALVSAVLQSLREKNIPVVLAAPGEGGVDSYINSGGKCIVVPLPSDNQENAGLCAALFRFMQMGLHIVPVAQENAADRWKRLIPGDMPELLAIPAHDMAEAWADDMAAHIGAAPDIQSRLQTPLCDLGAPDAATAAPTPAAPAKAQGKGGLRPLLLLVPVMLLCLGGGALLLTSSSADSENQAPETTPEAAVLEELEHKLVETENKLAETERKLVETENKLAETERKLAALGNKPIPGHVCPPWNPSLRRGSAKFEALKSKLKQGADGGCSRCRKMYNRLLDRRFDY